MTGLIQGIYNSDGVIVARYVYDAFGNHKVCDGSYNANTNDSFIGNINPFRYKSYYYDKESNLYYLNSRYYSPIYYRFISIDDIDYLKSESINGINLYAYCRNDPINRWDYNGHAWYHLAIGAIVAIAIITLSIYTAGAILAAAPALTDYASVIVLAYTGSVALGHTAATAISMGSGILAIVWV